MVLVQDLSWNCSLMVAEPSIVKASSLTWMELQSGKLGHLGTAEAPCVCIFLWVYVVSYLQHGSFRTNTWKIRSPKVHVPGQRERERESSRWSYIDFYNLASEVREVSFLPCSHSWSSYKDIPRFEGMDQRPHLSIEDCQYHFVRRACEIGLMLVWPSLENPICQRYPGYTVP